MALTRAQIEANIAALVNHVETTHYYLKDRISTLDAATLAVLNAGSGTYSPNSYNAVKGFRATAAQALAGNVLSQMLAPQFQEIAEFLGRPQSTSFIELWYALRDNMIANSKTVKGRNMTLGTPAADGSNVGTGGMVRLKVTDNPTSEQLEACPAEPLYTAECIGDQTSSNAQGRHNEEFELRGSTTPRDTFVTSKHLLYTGGRQRIKVLSVADSLLVNPGPTSWTPFTVSPLTLTALSGWTVGASTALDTDIDIHSPTSPVAGTDYFTANTGVSKPASFRTVSTPSADRSIYQYINVRKIQYRVPYYVLMWYNASIGTAVGTLKVTLGSQVLHTETVTGDSGWLRFPIPLTYILWPSAWSNTDQPKLTITWNLSSGYLLFTNVILAPMTYFAGSYYQIFGGVTPFVIGDFFTWTDALVGTDSILQKWFGILFGLSLPYKTDGTQTWADPTVIA